jgi:excisionase family DNA binding protein
MPTRRDPLVPLRAAASRLSISLRTLRVLIAAGSLPVIRVSPRRLAIDPVDLEHYIEKCRQ